MTGPAPAIPQHWWIGSSLPAPAGQGGLQVEVAAFEAWDPAGRAFDAVIAGQVWHWVDPLAGAAKAAQVLRPGGRLAVFRNAFQPPPGLDAALPGVYRQVLPGSPTWEGCLVSESPTRHGRGDVVAREPRRIPTGVCNVPFG